MEVATVAAVAASRMKKSLENRAWEKPLREKIRASLKPSYCEEWTVYKVPQNIRQGDPAAYEPQIVSIGPYHRGKQNLEGMEEHKWRYLGDLLRRSGKSDLFKCYREILKLESRARNCYSGNLNLGSHEFVETMVLDGCFIIEYFCKLEGGEVPMSGMIWSLPLIAFDLVLLENQIPFFILNRLFELTKPEESIPDLIKSEDSLPPLLKLSTRFLSYCVLSSDKVLTMKTSPEPYHLLHILHLICQPKRENENPSGPSNHLDISFTFQEEFENSTDHSINIPEFSDCPPSSQSDNKRLGLGRLGSIPCARELCEAGVKFKRMENASSMLHIKFVNGVMEIPPISIIPSTNSLFRNLIAFEQCDQQCESYFSSYARFMDLIVNTSEDVALLHRNKIIEHELGSDEDVARLFNNLSKGVFNYFFDDSYLSHLFKDVRAHCDNWWNRNCASLKHDYFKNPWTSISMGAAGILLAFALIQTIFTCLSYLYPRP